MIKKSGAAALGLSLFGIDTFGKNITSNENAPDKKKVLVIGAHPDDPESCCGGTMAVLKDAGYEVISVYMTKGEAGIPGKKDSEAAAIRVEEAKNACKVLGVRAIFMTQIDGDSEINKERYREMKHLIETENPDIVFTHWPIDSHRDHRVCSTLVYDAWRQLNYNFELFYFEAMNGMQSQFFQPTDYVDISSKTDIKREAIYCHTSQSIPDWYEKWHGAMQQFRGLEFRCEAAEAFIHLRRSGNDIFNG